MLSYDQALEQVLATVATLPPQTLPLTEAGSTDIRRREKPLRFTGHLRGLFQIACQCVYPGKNGGVAEVKTLAGLI